MGYFPNGSAGSDYHDTFCIRCVHNQQVAYCPCWAIHMQCNYEECGNENSLLHKMIPLDKNHNNLKCIFFEENTDKTTHVRTFRDLDDWNKMVESFNKETNQDPATIDMKMEGE